ncbi:MAG: DUF2993 domain-containing protein [Actinobacteria bacterium]|nr:DUF2993 domain-containing protein [Actinomycetota bacterium]
MKRLGVILVVLLALLVVADYLVRAAAENAVANLIDKRVALQGETDVDLGSFPFLLSMVRGDFDEVTIDLASASEGRLVVEDIHLTLDDVEVEPFELVAGRGNLRARSLRGRGVISEATLDDTISATDPDLDVAIAKGKIAVSRGAVTVPATAVVAVNRLLLSAGGAIGPVEIPLPALLPDVRFSSLRAERGRLVLGVTASHVTIRP